MVRIPVRRSAASRWSRRLAVFAVPVMLLTVALHRFGQIDTPPALVLLGLVLSMALIALGLGVGGLVDYWRNDARGARHAILGIVLSMALLAWPVWQLTGLATLPAINDVTTDWQSPPPFRAAVADRPGWARDVAYPREYLMQQAAAYPEIVAVFLNYDAGLVHETALALIRQRGWRLLASQPPTDPAPGRIEAVAHTLVFGFSDDVALRITRRGFEQTRVDMRSASRFGQHDLGANAERIYAFLTDLQAVLDLDIEAVPLPDAEEDD